MNKEAEAMRTGFKRVLAVLAMIMSLMSVHVIAAEDRGAELPFEFTRAELDGDVLTLEVGNTSGNPVTAVNAAAFYNDSTLVRIVTSELNGTETEVKYNVGDIEFDSVQSFIWDSLTGIRPLAKPFSAAKADLPPKENPTPEPTEEPTPEPTEAPVEPEYKDIPIVTITGDITGISRDVTKDVVLTYKSQTDEFTAYSTIKWQGRSSVTQGYPKYNYSLKMYEDEARSKKLKRKFKTWDKAYNYCLKANWMDSTHARNIVNARLAASIQKQPLPSGATGLVDGFPIHVYLNGEDQGIYTWNIPKKSWTFDMDSSDPNQIVFGCENQTGACLFEAESRSDSDWELVCPDPEESPNARDKLNRLIRFVRDSSADEFKTHFGEYLDLDSTLNYYVFAHIIAHTDGFSKNMLLATYDGNVWYPTLYDMDSTWGLRWTGNKIIGADVLYNPSNTEGKLYRTSRLWDKFEQAFGNEIYDRYTELINNELTDDKIIAAFEYFMDGIGQEMYDLDEQVWEGKSSKHPYIPSRNFRLDQIIQFMRDRKPYTQAWMEGLRTE